LILWLITRISRDMNVGLRSRCFFFLSSRRRHTRWPRDSSSDVCSSDLLSDSRLTSFPSRTYEPPSNVSSSPATLRNVVFPEPERSEERRVGKECRARRSGEQ